MKTIKVKFKNGLSFQAFYEEVFKVHGLTAEFEFVESEDPQFIIFGPYGNDIPPPGPYTRVGYFCENILPDLQICDWAFGVPREGEINDIRYKRIQWHGLAPAALVKSYSDTEIDYSLSQKSKFCNFLFSNKIPYREAFFTQLSKYKKVDAPGRSMKNMKSIDDNAYKGSFWERKKSFLSDYKFTISFENYVYPGYQTEKLYDAMLSNSLPIYCGDPDIGRIFNTKSFINTADYVELTNTPVTRALERFSQQNLKEYQPRFYRTPYLRVSRKMKSMGRELKMRIQFNKLDFSPLIEKIIEIDQNDALYLKYAKEPWLNQNLSTTDNDYRQRWIEILSK